MNNISVHFNNKNLILFYRSTNRKSGDIDKNIDFQTIKEIYDENVYRVTAEHLSGDKIVVDLGGHAGYFSIMAAALGASKVYVVEPNPENATMIRRNMNNNNYENIIVPIQKAIWPIATTLQMDDCSADSKVDDLSILESDISRQVTHGLEHGKFIVDTITFDRLIEENGIEEIDILKVDIEWSEYEVFPSLSDETMKKIKYIAMEWHGCDDPSLLGSLVSHLTRSFCVETLGSYERGGFLFARRY